MNRLLLTTVFRPFGIENKYNKKGDEYLLDYLSSRLTREPGLFSLSSYLPSTGLHLIAANMPFKTKVLEYPNIEEFIEEVKNGYDYIGINFLYKGYRKVFRMISLIQKHSPKTKIIIGGFGTDIHNSDQMGADYTCKGEGVSFMRNLFGHNEGKKMVHPVITANVTLKVLQKYNFIYKPKMGIITSGFGCPNACDFCCTSAYYGHKNIPFLERGRDVYETMLNVHKNTDHEVDNFMIYEEDLMLYEDKVKELGKFIQRDDKNTFSYACFGSVSALSNYDLEELASMGVGHIWIGVESKNPPFKKRRGRDIKEIFHELRLLGITTTGSSIFGLTHHDHNSLAEEVDFMISLKPSTSQFSNLMPGLNTELKKRLDKSNSPVKMNFKDTDLYSEVISHPNFKRGEINAAIFGGYEKIYNSIGPSIYRIFDTWFTGYKNLRKSKSKLLRRRADSYARKTKSLLPIFLYTNEYLPNDEIRMKVKDTTDEVISELGSPSLEQLASAELIGNIFALESAKQKHLEAKCIEPSLFVANYDNRNEGELSPKVVTFDLG